MAWDVDSEGHGRGWGCENSVLSALLCCLSKTAPQNKVTNINIRELVFKIANAIFSYQLFKVECVLVKANELF